MPWPRAKEVMQHLFYSNPGPRCLPGMAGLKACAWPLIALHPYLQMQSCWKLQEFRKMQPGLKAFCCRLLRNLQEHGTR